MSLIPWEYLSDTHFLNNSFFVVFFVAVLVFYSRNCFLWLCWVFVPAFGLLSSCSGLGTISPSAVRGLLIAVASTAYWLQQLAVPGTVTCSVWNLPGPDTRHNVFPALAGITPRNHCTTRDVLSALSESKQTHFSVLQLSLQHGNGFSAKCPLLFIPHIQAACS